MKGTQKTERERARQTREDLNTFCIKRGKEVQDKMLKLKRWKVWVAGDIISGRKQERMGSRTQGKDYPPIHLSLLVVKFLKKKKKKKKNVEVLIFIDDNIGRGDL